MRATCAPRPSLLTIGERGDRCLQMHNTFCSIAACAFAVSRTGNDGSSIIRAVREAEEPSHIFTLSSIQRHESKMRKFSSAIGPAGAVRRQILCGIPLIKAFTRLRSAKLRRSVVALVEEIAAQS